MKETELAKIFIDYLSKDFEIFKEVWDVDIVACNKPVMIAVEVKTSLNFKVIEQAFNNKRRFHYSYIAVPKPKGYHFGTHICKEYGIGILYYDKKYGGVSEKIKPELNRHAKFRKIDPFYKTTTAGAKSGDTTTPFKNSIQEIIRTLKRHNGELPLKTLLEGKRFHWGSISSAKQCIIKYCKHGVIKEFDYDKKNGVLRLKKDGKI